MTGPEGEFKEKPIDKNGCELGEQVHEEIKLNQFTVKRRNACLLKMNSPLFLKN
jgi:hypothetical protein